jgi:hypothetical protein
LEGFFVVDQKLPICYNTCIETKKELGMSELRDLLVDAIGMGLTDQSIIGLMVQEGLPLEACPEILKSFKKQSVDH